MSPAQFSLTVQIEDLTQHPFHISVFSGVSVSADSGTGSPGGSWRPLGFSVGPVHVLWPIFQSSWGRLPRLAVPDFPAGCPERLCTGHTGHRQKVRVVYFHTVERIYCILIFFALSVLVLCVYLHFMHCAASASYGTILMTPSFYLV